MTPMKRGVYRPLAERFLEKISPEPNSGCWLWDGAITHGGYGFVAMSRNGGKQRYKRAHRAAFELFKGDVGQFLVCHSCDNPSCVNPDHLFLGTHDDNMADMKNKGRKASWNKGKGRLSAAAVEDIRSGQKRGVEYAAQYGVSASVVSRIQSRELYAECG